MIMSGIEKKGYDKGIVEGKVKEHEESCKKLANYFINEGFSEIDAKKKAREILS